MEAILKGTERPIPLAITFFCLLCVLISIGYFSESDPDSWQTLSRWGCPPAEYIWEGRYSALLFSVFVHKSWWHLAINLYWLWIFGVAFEKLFGIRKWLAFVFLAAILTSGIELAYAESTGMGASGVAYALFGFNWLASGKYPVLAKAVSRPVIDFFMFWLIAGWALTNIGVINISNIAHITGLLFGQVVACRYVLNFRPAPMLGMLVVTVVFAFCPLWCAPWSPSWVSVHARKAYKAGDFSRAAELYLGSLELGRDPAWVWESLALTYHVMKDEVNYCRALEKLKELSPTAVEKLKQDVDDLGVGEIE